jgi:hypothetical protein
VSAQPWMKFYPQDWRADEKLRLCSLAARGLWIEMLALMHRSERYGQLLISGHVPTDAQLAVQVGASTIEVTAMLADLELAGVFSRSAGGAIYSRRMTRDEKKAQTARKNGKRGGNPKLCNDSGNPASDNQMDKPPDKGVVKLRSQKPEKNKASALQKSSLDPEWQPNPFGDVTKSKVIVDSWSTDEFARQLESFKAHHMGHGSRWADCQQAWSTWVLNSPAFNRSRRPTASEPENFLDHYSREVEQKRSAAGAQ